MNTLPDLLNNNLLLLSVGLNPSIPSVKAGFYFANPRNRFWKALNMCGAFTDHVEPSLESCSLLLKKFNMGFTDLVKRPTAGCKDLKAADYREGSIRLSELANQLQPSIIWFHGKLTCQKYVQYSTDKSRITDWGLQTWLLHNTPVFVSPNPSPANAAYSLQDISDSYQALFHQLDKKNRC